jgi:hypothetical protein
MNKLKKEEDETLQIKVRQHLSISAHKETCDDTKYQNDI